MNPFLQKWGQFLTGTVRIPKPLHRRLSHDAQLEGVSLKQIASNQAELVKKLDSLTEAIDSLRREIREQGEDFPGWRLDRAGNIVPLKKQHRSDKTAVCLDCGSEFDFTVVEQEFSRYVDEPNRCQRCRAKG